MDAAHVRACIQGFAIGHLAPHQLNLGDED